MIADFLLWKEGDAYLVAHPNLDLVVQGSSAEEAYGRWFKALTAAIIAKGSVTEEGAVWIGRPPADVRKRWVEKSKLYSQKVKEL